VIRVFPLGGPPAVARTRAGVTPDRFLATKAFTDIEARRGAQAPVTSDRTTGDWNGQECRAPIRGRRAALPFIRHAAEFFSGKYVPPDCAEARDAACADDRLSASSPAGPACIVENTMTA
jgi:hypothetical protein